LTQQFEDAERDLESGNEVVQRAALRQFDNIEQQVPRLRQEIMDVLCGYLRMSPRVRDRLTSGRDGIRLSDMQAELSVEDLDVERAVQRLICKRLYDGTDPFKPDRYPPPRTLVSIDLTDATLVDFDLSGCAVEDAIFGGARFIGSLADFRGVQFEGLTTTFEGAVFECPVIFKSYFGCGVSFQGSCFMDDASFDGSVSSGMISFRRAYFRRAPDFTDVDFFDAESPDPYRPLFF
jgi:hypothetical protein